jgi:hypothetical protein
MPKATTFIPIAYEEMKVTMMTAAVEAYLPEGQTLQEKQVAAVFGLNRQLKVLFAEKQVAAVYGLNRQLKALSPKTTAS